MNRKHLPVILFAGIGFLSIGLGCFKASNQTVKEAKADGAFKIDYNGYSISLGMYPSLVSYEDSTWNEAPGEKQDLGDGKYEYNGDYYSRIYCIPSAGSYSLPGPQGYSSGVIWHKNIFFKWETIKWKVVKEDASNGITYFCSEDILDTCKWQSGDYAPANDWENSTIREFLNNKFLYKAFTDQERQAIKEFTSDDNTSKKNVTDRVGLLSKQELDKHDNLHNATPTGYAIGAGVYYYNFIGDDNTYAVYYLNSIDNTTDPNQVDIAYRKNTSKSHTTKETRVDCEIGVRPLIAIDNNYLVRKSTGGGGGGGSSANVPLILGIVFSVLGMAGVAVFLLLWKKGKLIKVGATKAPIWLIATICASLVISVVGVSMIFANSAGQGVGYSAASPVGYWSCSYFGYDVNKSDFGLGFHLGLTKDHKVYKYHGSSFEDGKTNFNLYPYDGVGSWQLKGKKLIITISSEWDPLYFEEEVTEYYATTREGFALGGFIMNYGNQEVGGPDVKGPSGPYRWHHASTTNPTGEIVSVSSVHYYDL